MTINYKYELGDKVTTPFNQPAIISMCCHSIGGITYLCMTEYGTYLTFPESQLTPGRETKENVLRMGRN
jgi:hypothetical protein